MRKLVFLFLISISVAFAGGRSTYEFLRLDISPRASSLGGAFGAMLGDPVLLFYNPSAISEIEVPTAGIGFLKHLLDINLGYGVYSARFRNLANLGIGFIYINYGKFTQTDRLGNQLGTFSAGEFALVFGVARGSENFKYGGNVKFIYSSIAGARSTAIAFDIGAMYSLQRQNLNIALTLTNFGLQLERYLTTKENLPAEIRFALSKKLEHLPLTLNLGLNKLNEQTDKIFDRVKNFAIGGEFNVSQNLDLRIGYNNEKRNELKIAQTIDLTGFSFGAGVKVSDFRFDYSYVSLGRIGALHQVSITAVFK